MSREDPQEPLPWSSADEDDAYDVPTKVGAMPAEVMARLRAEGLLPGEGTSPQPRASPPRASTPLPSFASEPSLDELTNVYAELSSQEMVPSIPSPLPPPLPPRAPQKLVETPVAFAAAKTDTPLAPLEDEAQSAESRAFGGRSQKRMLILLVAGMVAIVVIAFVMALLSQRR